MTHTDLKVATSNYLTNFQWTDISIQQLTQQVLQKDDYINIAWVSKITKSWFRKLAHVLQISTEILNQEREVYDTHFVWHFTVKARDQNGRTMTCCWSCASNEKEFAHIIHDVRATAQTRATNRAISDLIGIWEVSAEELWYYSTTKDHEPTMLTNKGSITPQQLSYLTILVHKRFAHRPNQKADLLNKIPHLSKQQATNAIRKIKEFLNHVDR